MRIMKMLPRLRQIYENYENVIIYKNYKNIINL